MSKLRPYRTLADVLGDDAYTDDGTPYKQSSNGNENYQVNGWRPMRSVEEPAYTVLSGPASLYPPDFEGGEDLVRSEERVRMLTVEEMALLQSFPSTYEVRGETMTSRRVQVGNAVPPLVAEAIAGALR